MRRFIFFISLIIVAGFFITEIPKKTQAAYLVSRRTRFQRPSPVLFFRSSLRPSSRPSPTPSTSPRTSPRATQFASSSPSPAASTTSDSVKTYIMQKINEYRNSKGLKNVQTDSYTCDFAKVRAKEITTNFTHDGFESRIAQKSLPYPSYRLITENIAMTQDYRDVVSLWINSPSHAANMEKDTPYVCVERSGNYFAYEGWKP